LRAVVSLWRASSARAWAMVAASQAARMAAMRCSASARSVATRSVIGLSLGSGQARERFGHAGEQRLGVEALRHGEREEQRERVVLAGIGVEEEQEGR
jgi:hypothetical protein